MITAPGKAPALAAEIVRPCVSQVSQQILDLNRKPSPRLGCLVFIAPNAAKLEHGLGRRALAKVITRPVRRKILLVVCRAICVRNLFPQSILPVGTPGRPESLNSR